MKILIVDDDEIALAVTKKILEAEHYQVELAKDGDSALEILHAQNIQIVISDWNMPNITGINLCRIVRSAPIVAHIYFILVTSRSSKADLLQGLSAGADDFISKPFEPDELLVRIRNADRMLAQQAKILESGKRFNQIAELSRVITWEINAQGLYTYLSHSALLILGYPVDELVGQKYFYDLHPEAGREAFKAAAFEVFERQAPFVNLENQVQSRQGQLFWMSTNGTPILDDNGKLSGYRGSDTDITERKQADEKIRLLHAELEQLAFTDYLTNLNNRRYFMQRGAEEVKRAKRNRHPLALILLDIDWFKEVNDSYGHDSGDMVLQHVAKVLKSNLREIDILGRIGGEEFAILLPNTCLTDAGLLAERVRQSIANSSFVMPGPSSQAVSITISLGGAALSPEMSSIDNLLSNADMAMYRAKQNGRDAVVLY